MSDDKTPWWYPKPVNAETVERLRKDYPEETQGMDDAEVLEHYEYTGCYQWLWDHTGEAADQADKLADEIFRLRELLDVADSVIKEVPTTGLMSARIFSAQADGPTVELIGDAKRYQEWFESRDRYRQLRGDETRHTKQDNETGDHP